MQFTFTHNYQSYTIQVPQSVNSSELAQIKFSNYLTNSDTLLAAVCWHMQWTKVLEIQLYPETCAHIVEGITEGQVIYFLTETTEQL